MIGIVVNYLFWPPFSYQVRIGQGGQEVTDASSKEAVNWLRLKF